MTEINVSAAALVAVRTVPLTAKLVKQIREVPSGAYNEIVRPALKARTPIGWVAGAAIGSLKDYWLLIPGAEAGQWWRFECHRDTADQYPQLFVV